MAGRDVRGAGNPALGRVVDETVGLVDRLLTPDEIGSIPRSQLIVRARTEWAFMNVTTGRPTRIPAVIVRDFLILE